MKLSARVEARQLPSLVCRLTMQLEVAKLLSVDPVEQQRGGVGHGWAPVGRSARGWALALLAAACLGVPASSAAHVIQVARSAASSASDGRLLWARCPHGICSLYTRAAGTTSRLPIAAFDVPDDAQSAELGLGPHRDQVAAYSRCRLSLRHCDLYMYDFRTATETRLPVSAAHGALMAPTISGDRVAYAYNPRGHDGHASSFHLYWSLIGSRQMHRIATMPFSLNSGTLPTLDLSGDRLVYGGYSGLTSCLDQSQIRIARLGARGPDHLVAQGSTRTDVFSPHWDQGAVYYGRDLFTVASYRHSFTRGEIARSRVERYLPAVRRMSATTWTSLAITAVLPDGRSLMYQLVTGSARADGLYAAGRPSFHSLRAQR